MIAVWLSSKSTEDKPGREAGFPLSGTSSRNVRSSMLNGPIKDRTLHLGVRIDCPSNACIIPARLPVALSDGSRAIAYRSSSFRAKSERLSVQFPFHTPLKEWNMLGLFKSQTQTR